MLNLSCSSLLQAPTAGDSDQGISLGPGGRGMGAWGRGASGGGGGMSQSMIGGGGSSSMAQDTRTNRYQLLEDDTGAVVSESGKAPFAGRSSLGGPPSVGSGVGRNQEYRMPGATKSAFFAPKEGGDRERNFESSRPQNSGQFLYSASISMFLCVDPVSK